MREWKIAKTYAILDCIFCVSVAQDDPHVLAIFAGYNISKLSKIYEFSYEKESEIDSFATETVPMIIRNYLIQKTGASYENLKNKTVFREKEEIIEYLNQIHRWASVYAIADETNLTLQKTKALLKSLEMDGRILKGESPSGILYFRTP